jgi:hypothetical protein
MIATENGTMTTATTVTAGQKSSRTRQLHRHRPDFYPKTSTLLIFIFNIIFITTFLHNVLVMVILQITFVHVCNLKYNIQLYLMQILDQSC